MDAPVIKGLYNTLVTNIVGDGLRPEPTPDAEYLGMTREQSNAWKSNVLRLWEAFAESTGCDASRENNFYELQRLACWAQFESGDVFVTMPRFRRGNELFALKAQVIEADCVADPDSIERQEFEKLGYDCYGGVERTKWGNVAGYWFYTGHPLAIRRRAGFRYHDHEWPRWFYIPAYGAETGLPNILHLMEAQRPGQRRGVPMIAPIIPLILVLDRYVKAEVIAAEVQSLFTVMIESETPEAMAGQFAASEGDSNSDPETEIGLGPGIIQFLRPGDKASAFNPSRPTTAFAHFIESVLQMMGPAVSMPYEVLVQKYQSSYSASQAAMNHARANFKVKRTAFNNDFNQPIYEALIDEAVARGMLDAPGYFDNPLTRRALTRAKWAGPAMLGIDALKDVRAGIERVTMGFSTAAEVCAELTGGDYTENLSVRAREIDAARAAGLLPAVAQGLTDATAINAVESQDEDGEENADAED